MFCFDRISLSRPGWLETGLKIVVILLPQMDMCVYVSVCVHTNIVLMSLFACNSYNLYIISVLTLYVKSLLFTNRLFQCSGSSY